MVTLIALHGSGRDETDLAGFAAGVAPRAALVAPRGDFAEAAGFTFFRRRADRSIDAGDLLSCARAWLPAQRGLPPDSPLILAGYSSGAIFAEALVAIAPRRFAGAILLRPEPIAADFRFPPLAGLPVLILAGAQDARRRPEDAPRLAAQLQAAGARVETHVMDCGHDWAPGDQDATLARAWLA